MMTELNQKTNNVSDKKDISNKRLDLPLLLLCFVIILMPLSFLSKGIDVATGEQYTYRIGSYILFFEAVLLFALPYSLLNILSGRLQIKIRHMDILLICFLFLLLIPTVLSWDILYIAMREFRHAYLVPFLVYLLFKVCVRSKQQLSIALKAFVIPVIIEAAFVVKYFIEHGSRVDIAEYILLKVVLSVVLALGLIIIIFLPWQRKNSFYRIAKYMLFILVLLAIILSAGRTALFTVVSGLIFIYYFINKRWFQNIYKFILPIMVVLMFILAAVVSTGEYRSDTETTKEERYSVSRVVSAEQFKESALNRIELWQAVITLGKESPIYGLGLKFYEKYHLGASHTHNVYLNIFASAGIIGLLIFMYILSYTFNRTFNVINNSEDELLTSLAKVTFFFGMLLMLAGATNAYEGGLQPILFLYFAVVGKLVELNVKSDDVASIDKPDIKKTIPIYDNITRVFPRSR